jgi:hypothetical protein
VPSIFYLREFAAADGLMSYGTSVTNGYRLDFSMLNTIAHELSHQTSKAGDVPADVEKGGAALLALSR